ncbi:hypothetical protein BROUX41_005215 [Berkeleyomyces rouxiae]|uniref:uncharacterized protein n=1 Tax=Berkeleyomyces rouxiae TaxID=2035830 RepID=UPI003B7DC4ED
MDPSRLSEFTKYSPCDVSDALVKLNVPGGGVLIDFTLCGGQREWVSRQHRPEQRVAALASTVLFVRKGSPVPESAPLANIPADCHWADLSVPGTIVVIQQPRGQKNAVCGGTIARRMWILKLKGIMVDGRIRDAQEMPNGELAIWYKGLSTVGAGAASTPHAVQVPLNIDGTIVRPGDIILSDRLNGVVCIPKELANQVLELLPEISMVESRIITDIKIGKSVHETFKLHRDNH